MDNNTRKQKHIESSIKKKNKNKNERKQSPKALLKKLIIGISTSSFNLLSPA